MVKQDGGYAFHWKEEDGQGGYVDHRGMTLRDYFAAKALSGYSAQEDARTPQTPGEKENIEAWRDKICGQDADYCYRMADAMIAARDK